MARLSDIIEEFIKQMLSDAGGEIELQRNDVANRFNCVPSQINYVIGTRFTTEQGYYVESRRGGGGCITIKRVVVGKGDYLMHIINNIGNFITQQDMQTFVNNFVDYDIITLRDAELIKAATSDKVLAFPPSIRDACRAAIFKNMLITLVNSKY